MYEANLSQNHRQMLTAFSSSSSYGEWKREKGYCTANIAATLALGRSMGTDTTVVYFTQSHGHFLFKSLIDPSCLFERCMHEALMRWAFSL